MMVNYSSPRQRSSICALTDVLMTVSLILVGPANMSAQERQGSQAILEELRTIRKELSEIKDAITELKAVVPFGRSPSVLGKRNISLADAPSRGRSTAPVTIVEFSDFQCPFCSRYFTQTFPLLLKEYVDTGKVQYIFRHFPLERIHLNALLFAQIAECAHEQNKFWPMHDWLLTNQQVIDASDDVRGAAAVGLNIKTFRLCMSQDNHADHIRTDALEAVSLGLSGTPTFAIGLTPASGSSMEATVWISGAQPIEMFRAEIERFLK